MVIDDDGTDVDYLNDGLKCVNEERKKREAKNLQHASFKRKSDKPNKGREEMSKQHKE
jgi:hypothetical protein